MKEKDNVYLWGISLAVLGVVAYYLYKKSGKRVGVDNYNLVLAYEPTAKVLGDIIKVKIDNERFAQFYTNNRFFIFKGKTALGKGTYLDGGRVLKSDDGKKDIKGKDIIQNLKNYLQ
jgi:hypothetical protein